MAIDANILLRGIVPDAVGAARQGMALGQQIKQAPLQNRLLEQKAQEGNAMQGQKLAVSMNQVFGDTPIDQITPEMYQQGIATAKQLGMPISEQQAQFTPENVGLAARLSQAGKKIALQKGVASTKSQGGRTDFVKQVGTTTENGVEVPVYQNFTSTFARDASGALKSEETAFGSQFTKSQGNPIISADVEKAGSTARESEIGTATGASSVSDITAQTASDKAEGEEGGKQKAKLRYAPQIARAIEKAKAIGEAELSLEDKVANLPLVEEMVASLNELAPYATSTNAGRVWDFAVKESGFGATTGSTARVRYQSIISNEMLPLLKATFGAAFTQVEGEKLEATLGDPNAAPEEKMAALDEFLNSQRRQIRGLQNRLGVNPKEGEESNAAKPVKVGRFQIKVKG